MRPCNRSIALATVLAAGVATTAVGDSGPDLSCVWRAIARRGVARRAALTVRVRATIDVACDGGPAPRRVTASLYASTDGVVATGAAIARKRMSPRPGRTVRVTFDAPLPFGAAGRYVIARVDDADEVAEPDEANNRAAFGPFSTGEEYAPLETGNAWRYAGTHAQEGAPVAYVNDVDVLGPHVVNASVVAQAVRSGNPRDAGTAIVEYLQRDDRGVVDWGDDDATDEITAQIVPYRMLLLPLAASYDVVTVARRGLLAADDYDGDGRLDRFNASQRTAFVGFEDVDLPVARFTRCAHVRTTARATLVLSYSGKTVAVVGTEDQWLAPDVGPVRAAFEMTGPGVSESTDETLTGAVTTTGGCGVVARETSAEVSDSSVGGFAAASDGSNVLVAAVRGAYWGEPRVLVGIVLSNACIPLREFQMADVSTEGWDPGVPSVAYGAGEFVVAYRRFGEPLHLRAVTADGAFPWGAGALNLNVAGSTGSFRVVFDGTNFLVLCRCVDSPEYGDAVVVARVSPAGSLLSTRLLADTDFSASGVAAASDGSNTLCVWTAPTELHAVRVTASGDVLDATPIRIATFPNYEWDPSVVASPTGGWFVAWTDPSSERVKGCVVAADGSVAHPDGVAFVSSARSDSASSAAFDGAELVLVAATTGPAGVHAVRVSADGEAVPQSAGGLPAPFAVSKFGLSISSPTIVQAGDRAMVLWRRQGTLTGGSPKLSGALVFPRRADLRSGRRAVR